jgi:hypothetical protein
MNEGISQEKFMAEQSEIVQELKRKLENKDKTIEAMKKRYGKDQVFLDELKSAISPVTPPKLSYKPKKEGAKVSSPCPLVLHGTDGHCGLTQPADEIEGFNETNFDIYKKRNLDFVYKAMSFTEIMRHGYAINECHYIDTGDNISGDIHDELKRTNEFPVPEQIIRAGTTKAEQIMFLAPHFEKIVIDWIVADNHSRREKKPQSMEEGWNSDNYLVGFIAKTLLEKYENVQFNLWLMHEKVITIANRNYLIFHGHGLPQNFGVPWYSIERKAGREAVARMQEIMEAHERMKQRALEVGFHKMVFGHFHIKFDHPLYMCGPSLSGTDANDHKYGRHSVPGQRLWMVHPKHGEVNDNFISL